MEDENRILIKVYVAGKESSGMDKVGERKDVRAGGEDLLCAGFVSRAKIVRPGAFSVADPPQGG